MRIDWRPAGCRGGGGGDGDDNKVCGEGGDVLHDLETDTCARLLGASVVQSVLPDGVKEETACRHHQ